MPNKSAHFIATVLWAILAILASSLFFPLAFASFHSKEAFASWVTTALSRPDLQQLILDRLQPNSLLLMRGLLLLALLLVLVLLIYLNPMRHNGLQNLAVALRKRLLNEWRHVGALPKIAKGLLGALVLFYLITRIYMIATVPLERDESMSYYYFIKPGPIVAMSYYPYPNNHPLYSLFAWPFSKLPLALVWKIRLPVLFLGLACIWVAFRFFEKLSPNKIAAVAGVLLLTCLFPFGRFSVYGRGYLLQLLIALLILCFYQRSLNNKESPPLKQLTVLYVLGFYTMPTFLYFSAIALPIMAMVYWQRHSVTPARYTAHLVGIGLLTGLLYLPFMITNGGWQGFREVVYSGYSFTESWSLAESWQQGLRGWNIFLLRPREEWTAYYLLAIASVGLPGILKIRRPFWLFVFAMMLLWLPMLAHLVQRHYIPERAFTVATIVLPPGLLGLSFRWRYHVLQRFWWSMLAIIFTISYCRYFLAPDYPFGQERTLDSTAAIFADHLLEQHADTIYLNDGWYRPVIEATYHEAGKPIMVYLNSPGSPNHRIYDSTIHYDAVVFRSHTSLAASQKNLQKISRPDAVLLVY